MLLAAALAASAVAARSTVTRFPSSKLSLLASRAANVAPCTCWATLTARDAGTRIDRRSIEESACCPSAITPP